MASYLDATGLAYFWGKIKDYIGGSTITTVTYDSTEEKIYISTNVADGDEVNY